MHEEFCVLRVGGVANLHTRDCPRNCHTPMDFPTSSDPSLLSPPDGVAITSRRTLTIHELMLTCSVFAAITTAAWSSEPRRTLSLPEKGFLAPLEVLVDGAFELSAQLARFSRLECGYRIRTAVHDPSVQDIRGIVELHRCEISLVLHHRSAPSDTRHAEPSTG